LGWRGRWRVPDRGANKIAKKNKKQTIKKNTTSKKKKKKKKGTQEKLGASSGEEVVIVLSNLRVIIEIKKVTVKGRRGEIPKKRRFNAVVVGKPSYAKRRSTKGQLQICTGQLGGIRLAVDSHKLEGKRKRG